MEPVREGAAAHTQGSQRKPLRVCNSEKSHTGNCCSQHHRRGWWGSEGVASDFGLKATRLRLCSKVRDQ